MKLLYQVPFLIALFMSPIAVAQTDSATTPLKISGYIEAYYSYDFSKPGNHLKSNFIYSHNRHNEVNINLGFIKAAYEKSNIRANLALMTGTYANANLAAESGVIKNIYEANVGVKISKQKNVWLDAGVFSSHIGFESAVSKDCWNLTRSILAENSPYYESGVKISYATDNGKWFLSGLILNGWQRIQRVDGNNTPAFGHQITFKPTDKITLNSSSFIGSDTPDSNRLMRLFHNFYGQFQVQEKLGIIIGFDMGAQQKSKGRSDYNTWYSPVIIAKFMPSEKISWSLRGEYYADKNQVIISTGTKNGFKTFGYSLNVDYLIQNNILWRIEARLLNSKDTIFESDNTLRHQNVYLTTSLTASF